MAINVENTDSAILRGVVKALNDTRRHTALVGALFHADRTSKTTGSWDAITVAAFTVLAANSSSLPTAIALYNEMRAILIEHAADDIAHKVADLSAMPAALASDALLATVQTQSNLLKAWINVHVGSTTYHYNADATNTIAATDSTTQGTVNTLLNEVKTDVIAHMASAPQGSGIRIRGL